MEGRKHRRRNGNRHVGKVTANTGSTEVTSVDEFRVKYLPDDEKQRVARHMTPEEIGEDFARKSLSIAKRDLA